LRESIKRKKLRQERNKIGDDYVDGKISKRIWRQRLAKHDKEQFQLEQHWKREIAEMKSHMTQLVSEQVELKPKAVRLGLTL